MQISNDKMVVSTYHVIPSKIIQHIIKKNTCDIAILTINCLSKWLDYAVMLSAEQKLGF